MTDSGSLKRLKPIWQQMYDLMLPPLCLSCRKRVEAAKDVLCPDCMELMAPLPEDACGLCGGILTEGRCEACAQTRFFFDRARAAYLYQGPAQDLVHALKYDGFYSPADFFATALSRLSDTQFHYGACQYVTAVPLHRVRRRERGFNQSELIARKLARLLGLKYDDPVYRRLNTPSQTLLSKEDRERNLKGAFALRRNARVQDTRLILIDDVFTTGSTVNEISKLLKDNGAKEVMVLTATRAA